MSAVENHTIAGSGYGNAYIDSLIWGHAGWDVSSGPITYYLAGATDAQNGEHPQSARFDDWSAAESTAFQQVLQNYSAVCGLTFAASASIADANLVEWQVSKEFDGGGLLGEHEIADGSASHYGNANQIWGFFNFEATSSWSQIQKGGDGYFTLIHELGHGMGLAHPHDGGDQSDATNFPGVTSDSDIGDYGLNQGLYTVMSYNDDYDTTPQTTLGFGEGGTLGALDIAALQTMYGANMTYHTGADVYVMPTANAVGTFWSCIWDAGGRDTIDNSTSTAASVIDLRAATLTGAGAGGYVSSNAGIQGGFTIARGVVIENAIGGSGADSITGNAAGNMLDGGAGADTLVGGAGDDTYVLDGTKDVIHESGGGHDLVRSVHSFSLAGQSLEDLTLTGTYAVNATGNSLANHLIGNGKANILDGATGADTMEGGAGSDTYVVDNVKDVVKEAGGGVDLVRSSVDFSLAGQALENLTLTGSAKTGVGNSYANVVTGNSAANVLDGGLGADTLSGGAGHDYFLFDSALSSSNVDRIADFSVPDDTIRLDDAIFKGLAKGALSSDAFWMGSAAHDESDRIIYDSGDGKLFFDDDGTGAHVAKQFATVAAHLALTNADFQVV